MKNDNYMSTKNIPQQNVEHAKLEYKDFETRANSMIKRNSLSKASYVKKAVPKEKYFHLHNFLSKEPQSFMSLKSVKSTDNIPRDNADLSPAYGSIGGNPSFLNINAISISKSQLLLQTH